jgi:hypothetical protein
MLIKTPVMAVAGVGFGACASKPPPVAPVAAPGVRPALDLILVNAVARDFKAHFSTRLPVSAAGSRAELS